MADLRKTSSEDQMPQERVTDSEHEQLETTNPDALKESARLGNIDTFLVKTDLEDSDQRQDGDQPDGRPSPMANADNPAR
jgi:hypothetical protein